ncbi:MAG TPA: hypothetical protein VGF28_11830 [Thermoanaerobaculia bacterium]|jgi:hypothetical protein
MSKEVTVEELREHLEEIIAEVQAGESVTIVREKTESAYKGKRFPFRDLVITPLDPPIQVDVVKMIREDRDSELRKLGR